MKVLLLIPPTSLDRSYGALQDFSNPQPSIGLAYMAAVLEQDGHQVCVVDAYVGQLGLDEIMAKVAGEAPQMVGISVLTSSAQVVMEIARELRKQHPDIPIVMGNLHASLFAEELLSQDLAQVVVHREGEITLLELVHALASGRAWDQVAGISYWDGEKVVETPARPMIEDLDALPFPAWHLFPLDSYHTDPRTEIIPGQSEMQILATRGCPNACTFCSSRTERSLGSRYRMRTPSQVVDEMEYMHKRFGSLVFAFMDLAFPLVKTHALGVCQEMIDRGLPQKGIRWATECRVKPLDLETLQMMRKAGCVRINFGIESGSNRILELLRKNFTVADVERAVDLARQAGIETDGMFMIGLPQETQAEIMQTLALAKRLSLRYAIFNLFVPYPGCQLYDTLSAQGEIHYESWSEFTSYPGYGGGRPVYVPQGMTHQGLMDLQRRCMHRFYFSPKFILGELRRFRPHKLRHYLKGLGGLLASRSQQKPASPPA